VMIAVVGTATALLVWRVPPAAPGSKLKPEDLFVPGQIIRLIMSNRQLMLALMVTSTFWMLGSVVQPSVNALGKTQLGASEGWTSFLTAMMAVGIPIGCLVGGYLSKKSINPRVVLAGAIGMFVCLALLALPGGPQRHLLGFWGSVPVLVLLGFFTGMFVVPIQVSLQVLPPPEDKGRMIAVMNQCNFLGILLGGVLFKGVIALLEWQDWPRNLVFGVTAAMMLPIVLFYRPEERSLQS
jgi:predicted MFS family arabinose efflux permease